MNINKCCGSNKVNRLAEFWMFSFVTHFRFPMFRFHQDKSSKLALYQFNFRNSLMLQSMPLSYGLTNLTSESAFKNGQTYYRKTLGESSNLVLSHNEDMVHMKIT